MEEREDNRRLPGEVVETYSRPDPREVVEVYTRPLPGILRQKAAPPAGKKKRKGLWIFMGCLAVAVALSVTAFAWRQLRNFGRDRFGQYSPYEVETEPGDITIQSWPTGQGVKLDVLRDHGEALTAQEVYRQVNPSVVRVMVQVGSKASLGTGVIFTEDGYILTNYHVVEGGSDCYIALDTGASYQASYVAGDPVNDLAVLKVDARGLPAAEFGDSEDLEVGDTVYAIGNPLGYELWGTMTDGIVSAVDRNVTVDGRTMTLIQTNAALNSGNSGGPLINEYGQVVGLNVIKMSSSYFSIEGLGFAIPSATMDRVVDDLLASGETQLQPVLGLSVLLEATQLSETESGLEVVEVTEGLAADRAGVRVGDYVLAADGYPLETSKDLLWVRRQKRIGDELTMTLWRDGEILEVTLSLRESVEETE
ncbi:trypsin-like peptidase domain-containing protein [Oscillibacter valericigenes]|uniref:S1C family serine protease n=1 Tax=Oscillibacter valericigenes TaxID=351091 RepID=UPI001F26D8DD|nr:trypsin-like peptidase domain-containing protein [Oscillibacter valericigenes]MCF2617560.1 trypsin-like peptidase domain-containing protein [Oscillibacter valericigenes]